MVLRADEAIQQTYVRVSKASAEILEIIHKNDLTVAEATATLATVLSRVGKSALEVDYKRQGMEGDPADREVQDAMLEDRRKKRLKGDDDT